MAAWLASRIVMLVCLYHGTIRYDAFWIFAGLAPLAAICLSRRFCNERASRLVLGAGLMTFLALAVFALPSAWIVGVDFASQTYALSIRAALWSPYVWGAVLAFAAYLVLGRRVARVHTVAPLLLWDALATGVALAVLYVFGSLGPFQFDPVMFVAAAVLLVIVRALWFRALSLTTLPRIALIEFAILGAADARSLAVPFIVTYGYFTWFDVFRYVPFLLLFAIPAAILVRDIHRVRRGHHDTLRAFD